MFKRYHEKARRVIFFARYEAAETGSPYIETEHLLLGLLREDKALMNQVLRGGLTEQEAIRSEILAGHEGTGKKLPTSVDLPLSSAAKRVLSYGAEEAERLNQQQIGTAHHLLGLLRESESMAAQILMRHGLELDELRAKFGEPDFLTSRGRKSLKNFEIVGKLRAEFNMIARRLNVEDEPATKLHLK